LKDKMEQPPRTPAEPASPMRRGRGHQGPAPDLSRMTAPIERRSPYVMFGLVPEKLDLNVKSTIDALWTETTSLRETVAVLKQELSRAEEMADHDPLLPVFNRRAFGRELSRVMSFGERYGGAVTVIFLDLDRFKQVNDTHGHAAGDRVLRAVADLLIAETRESDIVGRLGGDEFAIALFQADENAALVKAQKLETQIEALVVALDQKADGKAPQTARIGVTFGVRQAHAGELADHLIARADEAMYAAKHAKRAG